MQARQSYRIEHVFGKIYRFNIFVRNCNTFDTYFVPVLGIARPLYPIWTSIAEPMISIFFPYKNSFELTKGLWLLSNVPTTLNAHEGR